MTEKQKFNLERWRLLIQDRQSSGLSVRDWCSMNGYTRDAYYYWLGRLRKEALPSALDQLQPPAVTQTFVDVTPLPVSEPESEMTPETAFIKPYEENPEIPSAVIRKNGMNICIFPSASADLIQTILEIMMHA